VRYFIYKTTCIPTGKYYIGVHSERRRADGYIGCGVCSDGTAIALKSKGVKSAFIDSVIKYGYKNFKREVLIEFDSSEDAYDYEANLVDSKLVNDPNCLNIKLGGIGGKNTNSCKSVELINSITGEVLKFESQADAAHFLGVQNISGKKSFKDSDYILNGYNKPISIKRFGEEPITFYDVKAASKHTGIDVYSLNRLISKERKSCKGWFLSDFDFNSTFYKNAKSIRKELILTL
jgi:hypothetical protein